MEGGLIDNERGRFVSVTKSNIVERIYKEGVASKKEAIGLVNRIFSILKDGMTHGEEVKISGLGNFSIRNKGRRMGRNPKNGQPIEIPARCSLIFRPSQVLKDNILSRYAHRLDNDGNEDTSIPPKGNPGKTLGAFKYTNNQTDKEDLS